jgi:hypothetical protein
VLQTWPSLSLYHEDGSHPAPAGSYLAACVFYAVLLDKSPIGLPGNLYMPQKDGDHLKTGELNEEESRLIQTTAWKIVKAIGEGR